MNNLQELVLKKIVCRCHDVTEEDLENAINSGYDDIETLKRVTGITTGHCQGKTCLVLALGILSTKNRIPILTKPKDRPPLNPVTLRSLATQKGAE